MHYAIFNHFHLILAFPKNEGFLENAQPLPIILQTLQMFLLEMAFGGHRGLLSFIGLGRWVVFWQIDNFFSKSSATGML